MKITDLIGVILQALLFLACLILCAGLLFIAPKVGLWFVTGISLGWIITYLLKRKLKTGSRLIANFYILFMLFCLGVFAWFIHEPFSGFKPALPKKDRILNYRATLKPHNESLDSFILTEEALIEIYSHEDAEKPGTAKSDKEKQTQALKLEPREITGEKKSYFTKEISFIPFDVDEKGNVNLPDASGTVRSVEFCKLFCPPSTVNLLDVPKDSFSEALSADEIKKSPYSSTESITWTTKNPNYGIAFTYLPPAYRHFSKLLKPFIGVSSLGSFMIVLIGIGSSILFSIIGAFLGDKIKDFVKELWSKVFGRTEKKKNPAGFVRDIDDKKISHSNIINK